MKQLFYLILLFGVISVFGISCSDDDDNNPGGGGGGGNSGTSVCTGGPSTVTDVDGNVYNVVTIGNQCWMKENLKTTKYRNGDPIPTNLSNTTWQNTTSGAYAIYNNTTANDSIYGKLYNWYAVADPRGLCPTGWHVPSFAEWTTLENFLGGWICGGAMKEAGLTHWENPNTDATNSSGFSGLPGGGRPSAGGYYGIGSGGSWWSSTQYSTTDAWFRSLFYDSAGSWLYSNGKRIGFSVRCVRD
jgi:uncharacterized protein (TIGR02145 family)